MPLFGVSAKAGQGICTAEQVDAICAKLEKAAERKRVHNDSKVKRVAAERDLLRECEVARDLLSLAVGGEKSLLSNVFGGDCERFHRMRAILEQTELLEANQEDQRWDGFRKAVDTVEEVLKELGLYRAWLRGPPETLRYNLPELLEPGVVVHYMPTVTGGCAMSSLCYSVQPDLPQFLVLDSSGGEIRGRPKICLPVPTSSYIVTARNNFGSASVTVTFGVQVAAPNSLTYTTHRLVVGKSFSWQAEVVGGTPTIFESNPELPKGLELNSSTGEIVGIPVDKQDVQTFKITASNPTGATTFDLEILVLPAAPSGLSYPDLDGDLQLGGHVYLIPEVAMASVTYDPQRRQSNVRVDKKKMGKLGLPRTTWGYSFSSTGLSIGKKWGLVRLRNWENMMLQGCIPKLDFSIEPALPTGLHLSTTTGAISGTPAASAPKRSYKITASNDAGKCSVDICFGVISVPPRGLAYTDLPRVMHIGESLSSSPAVEGFVTLFSVEPALPVGLKLDAALGTISGIPQATCPTGSWKVVAENEAGKAKATLAFAVQRLPPSSLVYKVQGIRYPVKRYIELIPIVEGDVDRFSVEPSLPKGITLNPSMGKISGTPDQVMSFGSYVVTASNESGHVKTNVGFEVKLMPPDSLRYPGIDDTYELSEEIHLEPEVGGGVSSWSIEPALPQGITLARSTGVIHGAAVKPAAEKSYTVTASNESGGTSAVLTFEVISRSPKGLKYPTITGLVCVGSNVRCDPTTESGAEGAVYEVEPQLPPGLLLDQNTGTISGSPTKVTPEAEYMIMAANKAGRAEALIRFGVDEAPQVSGGIDQAFAAKVEEVREASELPPEPERTRRLGDWMVWMVHRAWINDPSLKAFDFSCLKMPLPHMEPRVAPKLCKAMATNTHIVSLLLPDSNFRAPQSHQLGDSLRKNRILQVLNIESNFIDSEGLKAIATAIKESPDAPIETLRASNQQGTSDMMGRPVEQAMAEMLQANRNLTRLGFAAHDPHWADAISRALLRNVDAARRRRKGGRDAIAEVNRVQQSLNRLEVQAPPDKAAWEVFDDSDSKMSALRSYVAEKRCLPVSQHLQAFAREKGVALGYASVAPLLKEFCKTIFDTAVGGQICCEDTARRSSSGTLSAWSEKNNRWSFHIDTPQELYLDFRTDKQPVVGFSTELLDWLEP